jgi:hypothetical protein
MVDQQQYFECACPCNAAQFTVTGTPIARFYCHCQICQAVYRQPFADVTAWWSGSVVLPSETTVQFKHYRPPPALRRGTCPSCGLPVVGFLRLAPFVRLAFVPAQNIRDRKTLPAPATHIFYHRRVKDIEDDLPKVSGYWSSELAVTGMVMGSLGRG